jgi:ribosomal protein S18 acetylase RimI-like enzyme
LNYILIDYLKIPTSNSLLNRYVYWQVIISLVKAAYVLIVNARFLGRPSNDNLLFLLSAYDQVFLENLSRYHRWFYYLFGKRLIHIYKHGGEKVGFGLFRINPIWTIHMCKFGILGKYQGKGLAKEFLLESINNWKESGFKRFSVYVDPRNRIAIKSYESVGFKTLELLQTQIYMEKKL